MDIELPHAVIDASMVLERPGKPPEHPVPSALKGKTSGGGGAGESHARLYHVPCVVSPAE